MKNFFKILGLIGIACYSYAGPSAPPAGNYILNVSTLVTKPATNVSSITVRDSLGLGYGTPGNLVYLNAAGVVTTTTTLPTGGDVFKASTQTMTGFNTFSSSTTFNRQVKVQTTGAGQGTGSGGSILVYATDETGMPFQIYTSSANQAGYFGLVNLIASNTNYANAMIYITGTSSSAAKADIYISNPRPNIQLYQTGGASPYGQFEFVVVGDTLQINAMNAGGSAQKARIGMTHAGALAFYETSDNGRYIALKASASISSNVTWILPDSDGTYGQALLTDGAGRLFFGSVSGGGGSSSMEVMGNSVRITSPTATLSLIAGSNITITTASVTGTTAQITISATGGGSGSGIVSPGTYTWVNTQGISVSTLTATSTSTLQYTTIKGAAPILSTSTLQSGATVYVSSGNIANLNASIINSNLMSVSSYLSSSIVDSSNYYFSGSSILKYFPSPLWNLRLGIGSIPDAVSGTFNTAVGRSALAALTSGTQNMALGDSALSSLQSGGNNTAMGYTALLLNVSGSRNTAVGSLAADATTGNDNTAVGYNALGLNTAGVQNTAIGVNALESTRGDGNVGIGYGACASSAGGTGTGQTCIGSGANVSAEGFTNATAIGYNASVTSSNMIQLGSAGIRVNTSSMTVSSMTVTSTAAFRGGVDFSSTVALNGSYGTAGQVLQSNGPSSVPSWATFSGGSGGGAIINVANQNAMTYYSASGSSNTQSGASNITLNDANSTLIIGGGSAIDNGAITVNGNGSQVNLLHLNGTSSQFINFAVSGVTKGQYGVAYDGSNYYHRWRDTTSGSDLMTLYTTGSNTGKLSALGAPGIAATYGISGGSGTFTTSLTVAGQNVCQANGTNCPVASGGASSLAVGVGTVAGYTTLVASPTAGVNFNSSKFSVQLAGSATAYVDLLNAVTMSSFTATQPILYNNTTGAFSATPISLSTGTVGTLQAAQMPALTGDITTSGGSLATTLASVVTANQYGSATIVPVITFDAKGRITAVSSATITGGSGDAVLSATQTFSGANTFSSTVNISSVATITALVLGTTNYAAYGSSGTITPDATMGNNISITLTSSATINVPINAQDFEMFRYRIIQDGAGSRAVTLGSGFAFGTDVSSATFSTAASKVDYLSCIYYSATSKCHIVAPVIRGY